MKRQLGKITAALMALVGLPLTTSLYAQSTFVYTNNNPFGPNSVSAFSVGPNGALTLVAGSPFLTGGSFAGGFEATSRIAVTTTPGNFLYATNDGSNSISGFSIDTITGALTPVSGSPFATGAINNFGVPLAVTPEGQFLYAGNAASTSSTISAFRIAPNGALTPIAGSPFPVGLPPVNMKVMSNRKFLAVTAGFQVTMFSIASNGTLTPVPGSPFSVLGEGLDVNCASNLLFAGPNFIGVNLGTVNVFHIASDGVLTPIAGSPFTFSGAGPFSLMDVLSSDDQHLFLSNSATANPTTSPTIASLNVAPGGSLTEVSGSPFPSPSPFLPVTMATNQAGTLLYVAAVPGGVIGFNIDGNGALSSVPGSSFSVGVSGFSLPSVAVFPPKSCFPAPTVTGISPTSAITGGPAFVLTVNGTNFVRGSTVNFNGSGVATTFVSSTQLVAAIPASDITAAGTFEITVANPGGTTSNPVSFTVVTPQQATQAIISAVNALFSQGVLNEGQDNSLVKQLQQAINLINAGKNAGAIANLDSFISEVNDLLSSGVLSPSQAASLVSAAQSVIAAI